MSRGFPSGRLAEIPGHRTQRLLAGSFEQLDGPSSRIDLDLTEQTIPDPDAVLVFHELLEFRQPIEGTQGPAIALGVRLAQQAGHVVTTEHVDHRPRLAQFSVAGIHRQHEIPFVIPVPDGDQRAGVGEIAQHRRPAGSAAVR
jgi:hypothetical protein